MTIYERALELIPDGTAIGLGSGRAAWAFVRLLGERIGRIHAESWRVTYAGLVSARYLAGLDEHTLGERWRSRLRAPRGDEEVLVAELDGQVAGFALRLPTCLLPAARPAAAPAAGGSPAGARPADSSIEPMISASTGGGLPGNHAAATGTNRARGRVKIAVSGRIVQSDCIRHFTPGSFHDALKE